MEVVMGVENKTVARYHGWPMITMYVSRDTWYSSKDGGRAREEFISQNIGTVVSAFQYKAGHVQF